jgi:hypothetical protein
MADEAATSKPAANRPVRPIARRKGIFLDFLIWLFFLVLHELENCRTSEMNLSRFGPNRSRMAEEMPTRPGQDAGPVPLVLDLHITHERWEVPVLMGNDLTRLLFSSLNSDTVSDKLRDYQNNYSVIIYSVIKSINQCSPGTLWSL